MDDRLAKPPMMLSELTPALTTRIFENDFAAVARVADVVEDLEGAQAVTDGRAPALARYNHAALLRTPDDEADALLKRITRFFTKRSRTPSIVLDPEARPLDIRERMKATGWMRTEARDLMLWDRNARHIFTEQGAYLTLATNAQLERWIEIATSDLDAAHHDEAATMLRLEYRAPNGWFWFSLFSGEPAGSCPLFVKDGIAQVGPARVEPEFRNKGVGLALINFVTRQSRKDGAEETYLWNPPNSPATHLCEVAGYHTVASEARELWQLQG